MTTPAFELRQLANTFHTITERISLHEGELAEGLARQTRLTREVHHRVKNNLQVVASLINLHARGVDNPEVARAYGSIQRRVDALAVVHRNHFAELEDNRGVGLRPLIGELAQGLRASVSEGMTGPTMALDIQPVYVSQDVAVPVSFLLTELFELAMTALPDARVAISLAASVPGKARLEVRSDALIGSPALMAGLEGRYGRVLEGLSRQLRSPFDRDLENGVFALEIPIVAQDDVGSGD
nr:sensor histidine kinase [Sphingobium boeckii]